MKNSLSSSNEVIDFWKRNLNTVEKFFLEKTQDPYYPQKIPALSYNTLNKLSCLMRMEKKFVSTVLFNVNRVLKSTKKSVVLLFDIDDTIGVSSVPEIELTTFRPSAIPLIRLLRSYCTIGILSNRLALNHSDLNEIYNLLDPRMIFSSRDASITYLDEALRIKEQLSTRGKFLLTDLSNLNKLVQLEILNETNEDYFFVVIDDLPYTNDIGMHGIYIGQYLQCYL